MENKFTYRDGIQIMFNGILALLGLLFVLYLYGINVLDITVSDGKLVTYIIENEVLMSVIILPICFVLGQTVIAVLAQQLKNQKNENQIARLRQKPKHLVPGRVVQDAVIRVHDDHHDLIHQDGFKDHHPEKAGSQHTCSRFFDDQESEEKGQKRAEVVHEHKIDVLGPTAYLLFVHCFTCFPSCSDIVRALPREPYSVSRERRRDRFEVPGADADRDDDPCGSPVRKTAGVPPDDRLSGRLVRLRLLFAPCGAQSRGGQIQAHF